MQQREIQPSIGALEGFPAPVFNEPRFGWRSLITIQPNDSEQQVIATLQTKYGLDVEAAGARSQSYDLRIKIGCGVLAKSVGLKTGNYEVKSLWRRNENCSFDRRFKVGQRGEKIYGMRDSHIKAFAMGLDSEIDSIISNSVTRPIGTPQLNEVREFFDSSTNFIQQASERRHSKKFEARLMRLAKVSQIIPAMRTQARGVLNSEVQSVDIVNGFRDVEGVFITAGPIYTLVTVEEIPGFIAFDSASSEGPKLRYTKNIPSEANKKERKERNGI